MTARRYVRRTLFALIVPLAFVAGGCGAAAPAHQSAPAALADFQNSFVALRYPATWRPLAGTNAETLHFNPMLYLSTQPGHDPCRTSGSTTECGWPIARLKPNGILIAVENRGAPGWSLASVPGEKLHVDGRPARRTVTRPGRCATIGGDETIEVAIARPLPSNWTDVTACLRGPKLAEREGELDALLASAHFRTP